MTEDLLEKAKEAQSPEELLSLVRENGSEDFTEENAEALYAQMHMSGELTDEEMEAVTGGSHTTVGGQKYLVVTSGLKCRTGQFQSDSTELAEHSYTHTHCFVKKDHYALRILWHSAARGEECGRCSHLAFTGGGTGYCDVSNG